MNREPQLYSPRSIARILDCSLSQVYKLIRSGQLQPTVKLFGDSARGMRFSEDAIRAYLGENSVPAVVADQTATPFVPLDLHHGRVIRKHRAA